MHEHTHSDGVTCPDPGETVRSHCGRHASERRAADSPRPARAGRGAPPGLSTVGRRQILLAGTATLAALAGCGSGDGDVPDPVTLTTDDACEVCGMIIPNHPGPSVEIFYRDQRPSGHENPARFCSTWEAFEYDFERDWTVEAFYVTDYSAVDWSLSTAGGDQLLSRHPEASAFVDAESVTFVVGSDVKGAMGRDLIGFSNRADAEAFRDDYRGSLSAFNDVTSETIAGLSQG
jgi:nitrous oxide reductase accessory protein NosL